LRINQLALKNFRAYVGEQTVDLRPVHGSNLTLIFGENMSGKTSLFLALNWCLFGRAVGRQGEEIPVFAPGADQNNYLINAIALENGDYDVLVRLDFHHDEKHWILERKASCSGDPLEGEPFVEDVFLRIDGGLTSKHEVRELVSQVLHHEASQFYFFDGELLAQYERWLDDPQQRELRVRQAVERVVGIAALRLYTDLDEVAQTAEAEQRRALNRERRGEQLMEELEQKLTSKADVEDEINEYDKLLETLRDESDRIEREHGELAKFVEEQGRLNEISKQIDGASEDLRLAEAELRNLIHQRYWMPLAPRLERLHSKLMADLDAAITAPEDELRGRLVSESLQRGECELCERELDVAARARLRAASDAIALDSLVRLDATGVRDLADHLRFCDWFRADGEAERLLAHENARLEARSRISQLEEDDKSIRLAHANRPRGDREAQMRRLAEIHEQLGRTRESRADALDQLTTLEAEIASLQGRANRIQSDASIQRMARISRLAVDSFKRAIEGFREAARVRVETAASEVFQELVTDPGYAGIQIDSDYRLTTIGADGEPLPIPSAGGQQLVTLALIGGLNAAAVHEAPIVMDTPAGRIDRPNRERILRWVQGLDRQVVLMVHSGELTPGEVREMDVGVGRAYRIEKLGPKSSEIFATSLEAETAA
jgi:DNA sulfur modification protein DndD